MNNDPKKQITHPFPRGIEVITGTIIRNKKGELLLISSPKWHGKWIVAGGHIEPGETIMDSAIRETKEELGINTTPVTIMNFSELIAPKDFHRPAHFIGFRCILETEDETITPDPREVTEYLWITPEDGLKLALADSTEEIIKDYIEFIK